MRMHRYDDDGAPSRTLLARLRKFYLVARHLVHCGHCRYHKGENVTHRSPHTDLRKRHVRWKFERQRSK